MEAGLILVARVSQLYPDARAEHARLKILQSSRVHSVALAKSDDAFVISRRMDLRGTRGKTLTIEAIYAGHHSRVADSPCMNSGINVSLAH